MEKCQRSPEDIAKYGALTEEQMERGRKFEDSSHWYVQSMARNVWSL